MAFSPDGKALLTGSYDKTARLWEASTGKPLGVPLQLQALVTAAAFSPDGKTVLTGSDDKTARLWKASTGKPLGAPLQHHGPVNAVAFSPDGKTVLTGSDDKTARLWEASTGKPLGPLEASRGVVMAVAFSPDGKTVLTGSDDETARLWEASTGKPLGAPLQHRGWVNAVAFSPDGKTVLTGGWNGTRSSGRRPPASPSAPHCSTRGGHRRGLQPRRQDRSHRERGQDRAALGGADRCGQSGTDRPVGRTHHGRGAGPQRCRRRDGCPGVVSPPSATRGARRPAGRIDFTLRSGWSPGINTRPGRASRRANGLPRSGTSIA